MILHANLCPKELSNDTKDNIVNIVIKVLNTYVCCDKWNVC